MKKNLISFATIIALVGITGMASATPILDQSNWYLGSASGPSVSSEFFLAQTITNGITGSLANIELRVTKHLSTTEPLIIQIRGVGDKNPTNEVLIEKAINPSDVGYVSNTYVDIDFSQDNLFFNIGDVFSIVLHSENDIDSEFNWWMPLWTADYQGGNAYRSSDGGSSWVPIIGEDVFDFAFQTYIDPSPIEPSPVPEPATALSLGIGLIVLLGASALRKKVGPSHR